MVVIKLDINKINEMKNIRCVYCIINKINNKMYIGSTKRELRYRMYEHFSKNSKSNNDLHKDIEKLGRGAFEVYVLCENIPTDKLTLIEMNLIVQFGAKNNGYNNIDLNGTSKEAHKRYSNAMKRREHKPFTKEHCENISKSKQGAEYLQGENNPSARGVCGRRISDGIYIEFKTISDAVEYIKETQPKYKDAIKRSMLSSIVRNCKGNSKSAYGFKWNYS